MNVKTVAHIERQNYTVSRGKYLEMLSQCKKAKGKYTQAIAWKLLLGSDANNIAQQNWMVSLYDCVHFQKIKPIQQK